MKHIGSALATAVLLAGCATQPTPEQDAAMKHDRVREVTCSGKAECDRKWGRAIQFVLDNSFYKIEIQTDQMIQTAGPIPDRGELVMAVNKVPAGADTYRIEIRGGCGNMFGCSPSIDYAHAYFVREVEDGITYRAWKPVGQP